MSSVGADTATLELVVRRAWSEVLGGEATCGDFFAQGGDSLAAVRMTAAVRRALGRPVRLPLLFDHPVLDDYVEALRDLMDAPVARSVDLEGGSARPTPMTPVTAAQRRDWEVQARCPRSTQLQLPTAYRLRGSLDVAALGEALADIVARHEALRTIFVEQDGELVQFAVPQSPTSLTPERDERGPEAWVRSVCAGVLDLQTGPIFSARLLRVADDDHVLCLVQHHILSDQWSIGVVAADLGARYALHGSGFPAEPPRPARSFLEWSRRWHLDLAHGALAEHRAHWLGVLSDAPLSVALGGERSSDHGRELRHPLGVAATSAVRTLVARHAVTPFIVLLASFSRALRELTGQDDLVMVSGYANRDDPEWLHVVGRFVSSMVLRVQGSSTETFSETLSVAQAATQAACTHAAVSVNELIEALPHAASARNPFGNVCFQLIDMEAGGQLELAGIEVHEITAATTEVKRDLYVNVEQRRGAYEICLVHATDVMTSEKASALIAAIEAELAAAARTDAG